MDMLFFHYIVILLDLFIASFLIWRIWDKKTTLWRAAKIIYGWVALLSIYHAIIYCLTILYPSTDTWIDTFLHPFVALFMLSPLLIAIIHWKGGHIL